MNSDNKLKRYCTSLQLILMHILCKSYNGWSSTLLSFSLCQVHECSSNVTTWTASLGPVGLLLLVLPLYSFDSTFVHTLQPYTLQSLSFHTLVFFSSILTMSSHFIRDLTVSHNICCNHYNFFVISSSPRRVDQTF